MIKELKTFFKDGTNLTTYHDVTQKKKHRWVIEFFDKPVEVPIHMMKAKWVTIAKLYCDGNHYGIDWVAATHNMIARSIAEEHGGIINNTEK